MKKYKKFLLFLLILSIIIFALLCVVYHNIDTAIIATQNQPCHVTTGYKDIKVQFHVHSNRSYDCTGTLLDIATAATHNNVTCVILTDHDTYSHRPDQHIGTVLFIFGCETYIKGKGSLLSVPSAQTQIPDFLGYGHIEQSPRAPFSYNALELINFHSNALDRKSMLVKNLLFDPSHLYAPLLFVQKNNMDRWYQFSVAARHPIPIFGGVDAHANVRIFGTAIDPYDKMFSLMSTHVLLSRTDIVNRVSIFEAIKSGRSYIAFDTLGDTTGFRFYAIKNEVPFFENRITVANSLIIDLPCEALIRLYRNDSIVCEKIISHYEYKKPLSGFWRVEVIKNNTLWIVSNQILVE